MVWRCLGRAASPREGVRGRSGGLVVGLGLVWAGEGGAGRVPRGRGRGGAIDESVEICLSCRRCYHNKVAAAHGHCRGTSLPRSPDRPFGRHTVVGAGAARPCQRCVAPFPHAVAQAVFEWVRVSRNLSSQSIWIARIPRTRVSQSICVCHVMTIKRERTTEKPAE